MRQQQPSFHYYYYCMKSNSMYYIHILMKVINDVNSVGCNLQQTSRREGELVPPIQDECIFSALYILNLQQNQQQHHHHHGGVEELGTEENKVGKYCDDDYLGQYPSRCTGSKKWFVILINNKKFSQHSCNTKYP